MNRPIRVALAVIATLLSSGAAQAQIRTVILSDNEEPTFKVAAEGASTGTPELEFQIASAPFPTERIVVEQCRLRVVPTSQGTAVREDQDVQVLADEKQVGGWSAFSQNPQPYDAELNPEIAWNPGSGSTLTLKTESEAADWDYYGGAAAKIADRPRLIVEYDLPSWPAPAHAGQASLSSTSWTLPDGKQLDLLANPVSYEGAVYLIAAPDGTQRLYRVAAEGVNDWTLGPTIQVAKRSFACVTAWGRLQIITTNAIGSCDLENLKATDSVANCVVNKDNRTAISVKAGETPAMGPDGSLYFKNVGADDRIVAYNPLLQEIWRTELLFTSVSPISLSENGHYAYVLADISVDERATRNRIVLLRIDTATGETVRLNVEDTDNEPPLLVDLHQPAVASKEDVDYVFAAGNTHDTGIFQLVKFDTDEQGFPEVLWSRSGKVTESKSSVADRFSMTVFGDGSLDSSPFDFSAEAVAGELQPVGSEGVMLVDGTTPLFVLFNNQEFEKRLDEVSERLHEQGQQLNEFSESLKDQDEKIVEVAKSLDEQEQKLDQEFDQVSKSLDEQRQELADLTTQIAGLSTRTQTKRVAWGLAIGGVAIGVCSLLTCWILMRRKADAGPETAP